MSSFKSVNLSAQMTDALAKMGYVMMSPIQEQVIPKILRGESLVATSATGSGKTHSFLVPIIERINLKKHEVQAIILSPTRELAKQTYDFAKAFTKFYPSLRVRLLSPEVEKTRSKEQLNNHPHIIIATPGRLIDLGITDATINMMAAEMIVLDEADMLLDLGFVDDINRFIDSLINPTLMVFSATLNDKVGRLIEKYIKAENYIKLDNMTSNNVKHYAVDVKHGDLMRTILTFIKIKNPYFLMIFASKKETVDKVYAFLKSEKINIGVIHGGLETRERKTMMRRIRDEEFNVVVCSDMAARGIDISDVTEVLNIDLPKDLSFYFHRAGRTGRFDQKGECYTFYNSDTVEGILKLEKLNVKFEYLTLKDDELKPGKPIAAKRIFKTTANKELDAKIKKAVAFNSTSEVKPGYKKKVKDAVNKAKRDHRREIIREDIKKRKVERYKDKARREKSDE